MALILGMLRVFTGKYISSDDLCENFNNCLLSSSSRRTVLLGDCLQVAK